MKGNSDGRGLSDLLDRAVSLSDDEEQNRDFQAMCSTQCRRILQVCSM